MKAKKLSVVAISTMLALNTFPVAAMAEQAGLAPVADSGLSAAAEQDEDGAAGEQDAAASAGTQGGAADAAQQDGAAKQDAAADAAPSAQQTSGVADTQTATADVAQQTSGTVATADAGQPAQQSSDADAQADSADQGFDITYVILGLPEGTPNTTFKVHMRMEGTPRLPDLTNSADDEIIGTPDPDTDGYTWNGTWYTDEACTQHVQGNKYISGDVTYYTRFEKAPEQAYVHMYYGFESDDHPTSDGWVASTGYVGGKLSDVYGWQEAPTREGYVFKGWNTKADGTGETVTGDTQIATAWYAVYAQWEKVPSAPTDADVSSALAGQVVVKTEDGTQERGYAPIEGTYTVSEPTKGYAGYVSVVTVAADRQQAYVDQFNKDVSGDYAHGGAFSQITFYLTYKDGKWSAAPSEQYIYVRSATHTVTIDLGYDGDGDGANDTMKIKVKDGDPIGSFVLPERDGYTFKDLTFDAEGQYPYTSTDPVTKDRTLYAQWEEKAPEQAYVHMYYGFESDDHPTSDGWVASTGYVGGKLSDVYGWQEAPTREGYVFKGWNTKADGTGETVTGDTQIATAWYAVYAQWEKAPDQGTNPGQTGQNQGGSQGKGKGDDQGNQDQNPSNGAQDATDSQATDKKAAEKLPGTGDAQGQGLVAAALAGLAGAGALLASLVAGRRGKQE